MGQDAGQLLERSDELAVVQQALRAAKVGAGAMVLVEGPPGIGKSELLATAITRARDERMTVLSARGGELEVSFPFAVVRQLFEPVATHVSRAIRDRLLAGAAVHAAHLVDPQAPASSTPADRYAVLHGLYWLTANLAVDRPVALVVDDVHWSDTASLNWLVYLARRLEGLPVALLLGARPVEPGADHALLDLLRATDGLQRVQPAPLSPAAADRLARTMLGEQVEQAFSAVCHEVTAGNPFYVVELLRALRQDGVAGTAATVPAIHVLTPRAVIDATLARLGRLPSEVQAVAEAVALLEPCGELRWIAQLTGLDLDTVATAADALLELGMLRSIGPCRFEHPILRGAVRGEILPARRGRLHLKVARFLDAAGMPVDVVASHLMQTPPSGEPWVVSTLQRAARLAGARGASCCAATYLERALAEPPTVRVRRELLLELGKTENQMRLPDQARVHLCEALELAEHPDEAATAALWLGQALFNTGDACDACDAITEVLDAFDRHDSQLMLELEAYMLSIAVMAGRAEESAVRVASLEARTPDGSPAAGAVQATLAFRELLAGHPRERVHARVQRALAGVERSPSIGSHLSARQAPGLTLIWLDDLARAERLFSDLIETASGMGRMQAFEIFSALRGYAVCQRGELANAAADIEPILVAAAQGESLGIAGLVAVMTRMQLLVDDARPQDADELARRAPTSTAFERTVSAALLRQVQGTAQLSQRRFRDAAATLSAVGEVCVANGIRSPTAFPWRSQLALALAGTDRHDEGLELARTELALAEQCGVERARGVALRALGLLEGGQDGLQLLEAAVQAFERSPAQLELGWAWYELGAALRRANHRRDARAPLDRAFDLALVCGAELLAQRAREQLQALGARPRSVTLTGAESLTPSERRTCRLALQGLKNAEIAQALFVSLKTVETHLHSSYRKLDITSRAQLPQTLGAPQG